MDGTQLQQLTPEERDQYITFEDLFAHKGWPMFLEWAKSNAMREGINGANANTWAANRIAFGARQAFEAVANFDAQTLGLYEAAATERAEDVQLQMEEEYE